MDNKASGRVHRAGAKAYTLLQGNLDISPSSSAPHQRVMQPALRGGQLPCERRTLALGCLQTQACSLCRKDGVDASRWSRAAMCRQALACCMPSACVAPHLQFGSHTAVVRRILKSAVGKDYAVGAAEKLIGLCRRQVVGCTQGPW